MSDLSFALYLAALGLAGAVVVYVVGKLVEHVTTPFAERPKVRAVLEALGSDELYGKDIAAKTMRRNADYVLLARMEDEGLIESRLEPVNWRRFARPGHQPIPRRMYRRTHGVR